MAQIAAQQLQAVGLDVKANVPAEGIDWGRSGMLHHWLGITV